MWIKDTQHGQMTSKILWKEKLNKLYGFSNNNLYIWAKMYNVFCVCEKGENVHMWNKFFKLTTMKILLSLEVTYSMCELFLNILGQIIRIWVFSIFLRFIYYCTTLFYFEMHTFYCGSWYDAKFLLIVAVTPLYYPQKIYTYIYFMLC